MIMIDSYVIVRNLTIETWNLISSFESGVEVRRELESRDGPLARIHAR